MKTFSEWYDEAIERARLAGLSKAAVAKTAGMAHPNKISTYRDNPWNMPHRYVEGVARAVGFSPAESDDFLVAWFRSRATRSSYSSCFDVIWRYLETLGERKRREVARDIVSAYIAKLDD